MVGSDLPKHCGIATLNLPGMQMFAIQYNHRGRVAIASLVMLLEAVQQSMTLVYINLLRQKNSLAE
jgi:hypothetical protein